MTDIPVVDAALSAFYHAKGPWGSEHRKAMRAALAAAEQAAANTWRETVRDLYDDLHFGEDNFFTGSRLAKRLINFIEDRHSTYFCGPPPGAKP